MKMTLPFDKLFLSKKTQDFVGINIGNQTLKGLIVKGNKAVDYFIEPHTDLAEQLKKIWKDKKISTDKVKVSLKNPSCLVRYFQFLKMDRKRMKEALLYELTKHIPFSPDDVYFDFSILEEIGASEVSLLLAIAKKDFINQILDVFEKQNLKLAEINLDSICLINLFLKTHEEHSTINSGILDIGYASSTLTILRKGIPCLTRDLIFSSKDIIQVLSNIKNSPPAEVESWLRSLKDSKEFLEMVQGSIVNVCSQIKSSFDYFEVNKGERVEKIYLTGGLAQLDGFGNTLKESLGIETVILNNTQKLDTSSADGNFDLVKNSFTVTAGLIA